MDSPVPCTIGLGSNTPDSETQIKNAIEHICGYLTDCQVSSVYESPAFNGKDDPYLNAVIHGRSPVDANELVKFLKDWETQQGRTPEGNASGHVVIDLDLVIFDSRILRPKDFDRHYFNKGYRELLAKGAFLDDLV